MGYCVQNKYICHCGLSEEWPQNTGKVLFEVFSKSYQIDQKVRWKMSKSSIKDMVRMYPGNMSCLFVCFFVGIKPENFYSTSCVGKEVTPLGVITHGQRHKPHVYQRQRCRPRTCQSMDITPKVDGLARIAGLSGYHSTTHPQSPPSLARRVGFGRVEGLTHDQFDGQWSRTTRQLRNTKQSKTTHPTSPNHGGATLSPRSQYQIQIAPELPARVLKQEPQENLEKGSKSHNRNCGRGAPAAYHRKVTFQFGRSLFGPV